MGYGAVTAIAALMLVAVGLHARVHANVSRYARLVTPLGLLIIAVTAAFVLEVYLLAGASDDPYPLLKPWRSVSGGPGEGAYLVALGGAIAFGAGVRMGGLDQRRRAS